MSQTLLGYIDRVTPGLPPWEAAYEFLPWLFRWIAFLLLLPVLVLLSADAASYLYFRAVYQPWGRARTAFYKFPQRWATSRPASRQASPRLKPTELDKAASQKDDSGFLKPSSDVSGLRQRTPSIQNARAQGFGVEGPLLDPFDPQSPNMESGVPLPSVDEEETEWFRDSD